MSPDKHNQFKGLTPGVVHSGDIPRVETSPAISGLKGPVGPVIEKIKTSFTVEEQTALDNGVLNIIGFPYARLQNISEVEATTLDIIMAKMKEWLSIQPAMVPGKGKILTPEQFTQKKGIETELRKLLEGAN